jgi:hypothetical protein
MRQGDVGRAERRHHFDSSRLEGRALESSDSRPFRPVASRRAPRLHQRHARRSPRPRYRFPSGKRPRNRRTSAVSTAVVSSPLIDNRVIRNRPAAHPRHGLRHYPILSAAHHRNPYAHSSARLSPGGTVRTGCRLPRRADRTAGQGTGAHSIDDRDWILIRGFRVRVPGGAPTSA